MENGPDVLEYTGERMVPECADVVTFWEHIYRYRFSVPYVHNKRVLDIACGEGYGSAALLAAGATALTGVDVSAAVCDHALRRYNVNALVGDASAIPLADASIDVIISFETIEHLSSPELFANECMRVLVPGGTWIVSTPNRDAYHEITPHNPYHQKELSENEFTQLLIKRFASVQMFSQRPRRAAWWRPEAVAADLSIWSQRRGFHRLQRLIRKFCCPEVVDPAALEHARKNTVASISGTPWRSCEFGNPFTVRRRDRASQDTPVYLIAVATSPI